MSKKINFSVTVSGTEDQAKVAYSPGMRHVDKFALVKSLLDDCYRTSLDGVPDKIKNEILDNIIENARMGK